MKKTLLEKLDEVEGRLLRARNTALGKMDDVNSATRRTHFDLGYICALRAVAELTVGNAAVEKVVDQLLKERVQRLRVLRDIYGIKVAMPNSGA